MKDANDKFDNLVEELQEKYTEYENERDEAIASVKNGGLGIMKSVNLARERAENEDTDSGNEEL